MPKAAKSEKILTEILTVLKEQDLSTMLPIIEAKLNEEDCTAMELCAAFLKQQMGEEAKDIPTEDYFAERKRLKMEERRNRRDRVERYRSERDSRRGSYGNRDDRSYRNGGRDDRSYRSSGRDGRNEERRGKDGRSEERRGKDGNRFFGMEKKHGRDEKNSSRQIKTLPQNSGKKKENKISITEYKKRFKF